MKGQRRRRALRVRVREDGSGEVDAEPRPPGPSLAARRGAVRRGPAGCWLTAGAVLPPQQETREIKSITAALLPHNNDPPPPLPPPEKKKEEGRGRQPLLRAALPSSGRGGKGKGAERAPPRPA